MVTLLLLIWTTGTCSSNVFFTALLGYLPWLSEKKKKKKKKREKLIPIDEEISFKNWTLSDANNQEIQVTVNTNQISKPLMS